MTSNILQDKGFRKDPDAIAVAAKIMIAKVRRHIEQDGCSCCKKALEVNND